MEKIIIYSENPCEKFDIWILKL